MKKIIAIVFIISLVCLPSAFAGKSEEIAEKILTLVDTEKAIKQMALRVQESQEQNLSKMELTTEEKERAMAFLLQITDYIFDSISWESIKGEYINLYTSLFSESELTALLEFYETPIGRKYIEVQPLLVQESFEINRKRMNELMPVIQQKYANFIMQSQDNLNQYNSIEEVGN